MGKWIEIAREGEPAPGKYKLVDLDDVELALFHVDGKLCCIENTCTHDGGNLVEGDVDGRVVTCPRHGAKFDVCTGEALTLPAVVPTPTHRVRLREGKVEVEIED